MIKIILLVMLVFLQACSAKKPMDIGVTNGVFSTCPNTPNCVNSDAKNEHKIEFFEINKNHSAAWESILSIVEKMPNTNIIKHTDDYMHAEISSKFWGFIDDIQLYYKKQQGRIAVKSAARSGYTDFGVNRRRVENLRLKLINEEIIIK